MSIQSNRILIRAAARYGRTHMLGEYQELSRHYLLRMREVHPLFTHLAVLGTQNFSPLSENLEDLDQKILEVVSEPRQRETQLGSSSTRPPSPDTVSTVGFAVTFFSRTEGAEGTHLAVDEGGFELTIRGNGASIEGNGGVNLVLPLASDAIDVQKPTMILRLAASLLEVGQVTVLAVGQVAYEKKVKKAGDLYSGQWLLYLPFPDLGTYLPDDIHWEPFHKGILIQTTPHLPDAENPADVAAGKRVREVLDEFGFAWHSTYAIHGWPPDAEEWRYEEFITGAPPDRKYRVRCVDFDGYDSEREVLLYAKLFRRLRRQPKQWGLRGWDGPVINEARRQVRAANGTPIEWHIGLEESADRARTLLAEYTGIAEARLKIIHTPFPETLAIEPGKEPQP